MEAPARRHRRRLLGLIDADRRALKYPAGIPISNYPHWKWLMGGGLGLCVLVFATAWARCGAGRGRRGRYRGWRWRCRATTAGILLGVAADKMLYESYGVGGWLPLGRAARRQACAAPLCAAHALMSGRSLPTFLELLGPREGPKAGRSPTAFIGLALLVTAVIAAETALGFVFDPRYRDFPFAALTMAVVPFAALMLVNRPQRGVRPIAEADWRDC